MADLSIESIKNAVLRDLAKAVDDGNKLLDKNELSVFKTKAKEKLEQGEVSQDDYNDVFVKSSVAKNIEVTAAFALAALLDLYDPTALIKGTVQKATEDASKAVQENEE